MNIQSSSNNIQNRSTNFDIAENRASRGFEMPGPSVRKFVQFDLMKIDNWDGDYLDIYANDLLVKRLQFGNSGSYLCQDAGQGD